MKKVVVWFVIGLIAIGIGGWGVYKLWPIESPMGDKKENGVKGVDYSQYSFDNLRRNYVGVNGTIEIGGSIEEVELRRKKLGYETNFDTRMFWFESGGKKISGMINYWPEKSSLTPVIIMVRGYADKEGYYPGFGSWRVADELAKVGLATISIDFLGYGQSDQESLDNLEARFEKVDNLLDLLATVKKLPWVDKDKIGFWAHSNGGQIVLSVLEVTGGNYPTVLWAPMTNPFPQSVLSTIEGDSPVKLEIENFMKYYDSREYAFENYYNWINSPILIIQGDNDMWCEVEWQKKVVADLTSKGKKAELVIIPSAGHNMEGSNGILWKDAVNRTKDYFNLW